MFSAGDKVTYSKTRDEAEIISGPHPTYGGNRWLIRKADGKVSLVRERELSMPMSRVEIVARAMCEGQGGDWNRHRQATKGAFIELARLAISAIEDTASLPLAVGDKIRILEDRLDGTTMRRGDVLTVERLSGPYFYTNRPDSQFTAATWWFRCDGEGVGWERV